MADAVDGSVDVPKERTKTTTPLFGRWAYGSLIVLGAFFVLGLVIAWRTSYVMSNVPTLQQKGKPASAREKTLVDETPWTTAQALAGMAVTQEELAYAREAERLADHDVDQAFAAALRTASLKQKALTGNALAAQQHVTELEATVASDQNQVKDLTPKGGDDLDIAQAQLTLDQDELTDARADLARASGDQRGEIQQELTARQADMKKFDSSQGAGESAVVAVQRYRTLAGLIGAWQRQRERHDLLEDAKAASDADAKTFSAAHDRLEASAKTQGAATGDVAATKVAGQAAEP